MNRAAGLAGLHGEALLDALFDFAFTEPTTGCWIWPGGRTKDGYCQVTLPDSAKTYVHRLAYEARYGPLGSLCALHRCDLRCCFNPAHLFRGTRTDNAADRISKGHSAANRTIRAGELHPRSKLTEDAVRDILSASNAGERHLAIAERHGVKLQAIRDVIYRRVWRHVERGGHQ